MMFFQVLRILCFPCNWLLMFVCFVNLGGRRAFGICNQVVCYAAKQNAG